MFGDIGMGILVALGVSAAFHVPVTAVFVVAGVVFALLPDMDMLVFIVPALKKVFINHRGLSHYPLVYIPIAALVWYFAGERWGVLFTLTAFGHLVHDTFWIGWGIRWFWPLSEKSYRFFSQDEKVPAGMHWVRAFYLRPTVVSVSEYSVFFVSLVALFIVLT